MGRHRWGSLFVSGYYPLGQAFGLNVPRLGESLRQTSEFVLSLTGLRFGPTIEL